MSDMLTLARARYDEARSAFTKAQAALDAPAADADLDAIIATADEARKACDSAKETLDRAESLERARAAHKPVEETKPAAREVVVGNEERTYRPDKPGTSFFKDLTLARTGDQPAFDRLARNNAEVYESRAISQTATAGGEFVAPLWLNDLYAPLFRAGRPFVDAIGTKPLPPASAMSSRFMGGRRRRRRHGAEREASRRRVSSRVARVFAGRWLHRTARVARSPGSP